MSPLRLVALVGLVTLGVHAQVDAQKLALSQNGIPSHAVNAAETGVSLPETEEAFIQKYPDALFYKGLYLFAAGQHLEAAQAWERFLTIAPAGTNTLAVLLAIEEAYGRAYPEWLVHHGVALFHSGDFWGAERVLTRYLKVVPDDPDRVNLRVLIARAQDMQPY